MPFCCILCMNHPPPNVAARSRQLIFYIRTFLPNLCFCESIRCTWVTSLEKCGWLPFLHDLCTIFDGGLHQPRTCEPFYKDHQSFWLFSSFPPFYHVLQLPDTKRDIHIVLFIDTQSPRQVHAILSWSFRIWHV